jgi:tetratricopeptide (TPR) repeat protein
MDPSQSSDLEPAPADAGSLLSAAPPPRRTLPPPEWLGLDGPRSAASVALERYSLAEPIARRRGARALLESLSARMAIASRNGDEATERSVAATLAQSLAALGTELDQATKLARRSLLLGDDPVLREELSGWFSLLGEHALAAATLRPLLAERSGTDAAQVWMRIGTLLARAGEAHAARDALEHAVELAPDDAEAAETLASLGAWDTDAVLPETAAAFYLRAAERRARAGERAAAFENVLRAFEIAPEAAQPAERLSVLLLERGRVGAADEARREHARHAGPSARAVHTRRLRDAWRDGDLPRALGAALDARLDAEVELTGVLAALTPRDEHAASETYGFDELLDRLGLHELLAARLELSSALLSGRERARARVALGRLLSGPLARPDRAIEAFVEALIDDPGNAEARQALSRHALSTRDYSPFVEALICAGEGRASGHVRESCLLELYKLAEERLQDASLMEWAARSLVVLGRSDDALHDALRSLEPRMTAIDDTLVELETELSVAVGSERLESLSRVASLLLSRPGSADQLLPVLLELVELSPDERSFQVALERTLLRQGRLEELAAFYEKLSARAPSAAERARLCLALSNVRRQRGDLDGALAALAPIVDENGSYPAALSMCCLLAAQRGDDVLRARALLRMATVLSAPLRAVICSVAGEALLRAGDVEAARRAVDQAAAADPSLARAAAARAAVGALTRDRWGAHAIERALGVVVPRAELCHALAEAYDNLEEPALAFTYCLRQIALRPGDIAAARARLERALAGAEAPRLADTLAWLLAQPRPLGELAELIAGALRVLAPLEPTRAAALARRALDVLGPRASDLRLAIWAVADVVGERGLAIASIERWLASGAPSSDRQELLLDLSRRRRAAGDADGAARALMRAMREGAWGTSILAELDVALPPRGSDGEIALLFARAEALSALSEADQLGTAKAWRELGAAYWDLAGDEHGALRAWERAAALDVESGIEHLASDLLAFSGPDAALDRLEEVAARREDNAVAARLLGLSANIALQTAKPKRALAFALRSLELDSSRADVLGVVERTVDDDELEILENLYTRLAECALGRYGERAVHYRAARQFEKRRAPGRAFDRALLAFQAVPNEGVVFVTLLRLAEYSGQMAEVVRAIERVAAATRRPEQSAAWLQRAALLAGPGEEGLRQRVEVLLRALLVRPEVTVLESLARACGELARVAPDERTILELRMQRALVRLLDGLDGPNGARVALSAASCMLTVFADASTAALALERAERADPEITEFEALSNHVLELAPHAESCLNAALQIARAKRKLSPPLLELVVGLAEARSQALVAAELLLCAAELEPEQTELMVRAERAVRATGDAKLIQRVLNAANVHDPGAALLALAEAAERDGDFERAAALFEQLRARVPVRSALARDIFEQLLAVHERSGRRERAERLLEDELGREGSDVPRRTHLALRLAAVVAAADEGARALSILRAALTDAPSDLELLGAMVSLSRGAGDADQLLEGLSRILLANPDSSERPGLLREAAELYERLGNYAMAARSWSELLELDPADVTALAALERQAERSSDYDALVKLLARRAALADGVDEVRRIRLRRATVLEQRLGRADEARAELEALTSSTGDNLSVLRVLADLNERLGAPLRAAPLWLRASAVTPDRDEAADLSCRACDAYLLGGDVESARRVLDSIQIWSPSERVLLLAAEIERRRQDPAALADALDDLASLTQTEPERRAGYLVDAAEASLAAGADELALSRALRAAEHDPKSISAQLLARSLEYRRRGPGSLEDAELVVTELGSLVSEIPEQAELLAFLMAEALEASGNPQRSLDVLRQCETAHGSRPLVALALAERLGRSGELEPALGYFDAALGGDLRGLRKRGLVAWRAADLAQALRDRERAASYLEVASEDAETHEQANARIRELFTERMSSPPLTAAKSTVPPPPEVEAELLRTQSVAPAAAKVPSLIPAPAKLPSLIPTGLPSQRPPASLGLYSRRPEAEVAEERVFSVKNQEITPSSSTLDDLAQGSSATFDAVTPLVAPEPVVAPPTIVEPAAFAGAAPLLPEEELTPNLEPTKPGAGRYSLRPDSERGREDESGQDVSSTKLPKLDSDEASLYTALAAGSMDAGRDLVSRLEQRSDRTHDLVAVCRRLVVTQPGDAWALNQLHRAAIADKNFSYARAIEHVIGVLDPAAPTVEPPQLDTQLEQPDAVRALLLREHGSAAFEALALVWEGAEHVFRRDPSTYGVTGLERIPPGAPTPLARAYASVARALGMLRTPLFQRRSAGTITVSLALLSPPAVVLSGDVRQETSELRFHLGAMLLAATPQFVLLLGSPESQARAILKGLAFAFGPPQPGVGLTGGVPNLAEVLWESIPARLQRRLRELCTVEGLDYDLAARLARSATRRAGLFACGDLGVALAAACAEEGISEDAAKSYGGISALAPGHASIRSLLSLATSPEYAQVRWWLGRSSR